MIKTFIDKLLGKPTARSRKNPFGKREELPASVHGINPELVDDRAIDVVRTLKNAGFEAYIVGGAVRDLLLGLRPKDFDVATNASPEEVKRLFRRAFIIGKRFRIVHVVYGRGREHEVIEVSTFRAFLDNSQAEQVSGNERTSKQQLMGMQHAVDASGRVLRDNVWGPQDQDATRRDFTINAMYYDPQSQVLVDFHKGIQDAHKRVLRMIGDPEQRYREDPVRIIRAVRFGAKLAHLGFKLEAKTAKPLVACEPLLHDVPQSRLFDEMLKLLLTGHATASIEQLQKLGLAKGIYPLLDVVVERAATPLVQAVLQDTDRRVAEGKTCVPSFLLACVLWQDVQTGWQPRFDKRTGATPFSLVAQGRFRAGFDFLRLRADVGDADEARANWCQLFQYADEAQREDLIAQARDEQRLRQKTQKPKAARKPKADDDGSASPLETAGVHSGEEGDAPAKKRRRRRKKPVGETTS